MPKLAQILAIEKGEKSKVNKAISELHHSSQKPPLYEGRVRTYKPADDNGEQLPDETQVIQLRAKDVLTRTAELLGPFWDLVAVKDWTNAAEARADVVVDGRKLVTDAPVSWLLFMEKQLIDVDTFISKLPTLDASEEWHWDPSQNCYVTAKAWQNRSKKIPRNHTLFPGDEHHPPQVQVYNEDVIVGRYENIRHSGALPAETKERLLEQVRRLRKAVLFAREQANSAEATMVQCGDAIFGFLLEPIKGGAAG